MTIKTHWALAGILALAAFLRLFLITQSPPSLYWEEVALGYDAYSILKTGKDHHGHFLPLVAFESFGDWKPSGYYYALVPFVALFGLSELAVRLPSALAGILTVWLVYLIVGRLSTHKSWALWSALSLAILPWHIQFSRAAFEVNMATLWLSLGVFGLLLGRKKPWGFLWASIAFTLSIYTYHGLRVLAPLIIVWLVSLYFKEFRAKRMFWAGLGIGIVLMVPLMTAWSSVEVQQRIRETSLFSTSNAVTVTNYERAMDGNGLFYRIVHHRWWFWGKEILAGMISHFNLNFLFLTGDGNNRHQTGYVALLYPWMALPLLYGLVQLTKSRHAWLIVGWAILASIPAALTNLTPHTLRFLPAAPALAMMIGLGMDGIWRVIRPHRWLILSVTAGLILTVGMYAVDLWWVYPRRVSRDWQYGYKQVVELLKPEYQQGKNITLTNAYGRASMYFFFYTPIEPEIVQAAQQESPDLGSELISFETVHFSALSGGESEIMVSNIEQDSAGDLIDQINFLDGKPAFYVYKHN